jgi:excisionase family DNA binding protein
MTPKTEIPGVTKRETNVAHSQLPISDRLLRIEEVSALTGLAVGTLYHLVSQRRIPVVRLSKRCIRFRQLDLSAWIQNLTQKTR